MPIVETYFERIKATMCSAIVLRDGSFISRDRRLPRALFRSFSLINKQNSQLRSARRKPPLKTKRNQACASLPKGAPLRKLMHILTPRQARDIERLTHYQNTNVLCGNTGEAEFNRVACFQLSQDSQPNNGGNIAFEFYARAQKVCNPCRVHYFEISHQNRNNWTPVFVAKALSESFVLVLYRSMNVTVAR
jgi:hypothetical protein